MIDLIVKRKLPEVSEDVKNKSSTSFLQKIVAILTVIFKKEKENDPIISWTNDGDSIVIKNVLEFSKSILPKYFKHQNYTSFVRQLNLYDFKKSKNENQQNCFTHPLFKKGNENQIYEMKRKNYLPSRNIPRFKKRIGIKEMNSNAESITEYQASIQSRIQKLLESNKSIYNHNIYLTTRNYELIEHTQHLEKIVYYMATILGQKNLASGHL